MTIQEYEERIEELGNNTMDIDETSDFQCDQTGGFPTILCVNWEKGKAWLKLNSLMIEEGENVDEYLQLCADFGIRDCPDSETFNKILERLGEDAYDIGHIYDEDVMDEQSM